MQPLKILTTVLVFVIVCPGTAPVQAECPPISTTPAQMPYPDSWQLQWDPANPAEMPAGASVRLHILGGFGPYQWRVSGDGFSLAESQTDLQSNVLYAGPEACAGAQVTVTDHYQRSVAGAVRLEDAHFIWDWDNNPLEFSQIHTPATVSVSGGRPPYEWQVSAGFNLTCASDCGRQNSVYLVGDITECVAEITVHDACDSTVYGFVRLPGYWRQGFRHKDPMCYNYNQCGYSPELDFGRHLVKVGCCRHGRPSLTGTCVVDQWEYTATGYDCTIDNSCQDPQVWALYIWHWVCE
jgi:hypothetical protein